MTVTSSDKLSIVVVSYNTSDLTRACLRSVVDQTRTTDYELLVADNASADGSADNIERDFGSRVRLLRNGRNLGFAAANNLAISHAIGDWVLLLNSDTVVLDRAIDRLLDFASQNPSSGIYGGRTLFADGSLNPASCWGRPTIASLLTRAVGLSSLFPRSSHFNREAYVGWARDSVRFVDIVSGCFLLIRRALWERLDGFDTSFFMYAEDADLCFRAVALGARPVVTPDATIIHFGGSSESSTPDKIVKLYTARVMLLRKHWTPLAAALGVQLMKLNVLRRAAMWTCASLLRVEGAGQSSASMLEVWRRRGEWAARRSTSCRAVGMEELA